MLGKNSWFEGGRSVSRAGVGSEEHDGITYQKIELLLRGNHLIREWENLRLFSAYRDLMYTHMQ